MTQQKLYLSTPRPIWNPQQLGKRQRTANPDEAKQAILERDDHSCQFCGFRALKYQQIHHRNGFADDFSLANCVTACVFCHQCFQLRDVAKMGSGVLVWLPELSQADLHHVMRAIYVGRLVTGPIGEASRKALEALMNRRDEAKKRLGSDDPAALSMVMTDFLTPAEYAETPKMLDGIRLLPLDRRMVTEDGLEYNQFPQILAYWRSKNGPFHDWKPEEWPQQFVALLNAA